MATVAIFQPVQDGNYEWDDAKAAANVAKHGLSFAAARGAFLDSRRFIATDDAHSGTEPRFFCFGRLADGSIATVRFTLRGKRIRILGAGRWRKGKKLYEKANPIHG